MSGKRIAILLYEKDNQHTLKQHLISLLAEQWREDGHEVIFLFGIDKFVPADIIFVHVDLSVVPDSYLEFAARYPIAINGSIKDTRKSAYIPNLLKKGDSYDGPVIIKSNNNSAGIPERTRAGLFGRIHEKTLRAIHRFRGEATPLTIRTALDYKVYDHLREVPRIYFYHPGLVIQKFTPEMDENFFYTNSIFFLGDQISCGRLKAKNPIVKDDTLIDLERNVEPHPDILALRKKLKFDYGKFDYVIHQGDAILLDANKTVGWPPNLSGKSEAMLRIKSRARGLYSYF